MEQMLVLVIHAPDGHTIETPLTAATARRVRQVARRSGTDVGTVVVEAFALGVARRRRVRR